MWYEGSSGPPDPGSQSSGHPRGRGGTGRRAGFKIRFRKECRFDSDRPHHYYFQYFQPLNAPLPCKGGGHVIFSDVTDRSITVVCGRPICYTSSMNDEKVHPAGGKAKLAPAGERLLNAAVDLFYQHGIRAVGVDQVVNVAQVAKISLYRSFPSKDALIVAYLKDRNAAFWRDWDEAVVGVGDPEDRLRAVIVLLSKAIADPMYRGCPFAKFASEFPESEHAGRQVVEASRLELRSRLTDICLAMDVNDPKRLADALLLLLEGAFAASQTLKAGGQFAGEALGWAVDALVLSQKPHPVRKSLVASGRSKPVKKAIRSSRSRT